MLIISLENANTNTNTLTLNFGGTIADIASNAAVQSFFNTTDTETIIGNLVELDGADLSALSTEDLKDIEVTDDATLSFSLNGEVRQQQVATAGIVKVEVGGCFNSKKVRIKDGVTTVSEALNETVAAAFAKTRTELMNMNMSIDGTEVSCTTVLHDGDTISLQARKAGDKGAVVTFEDEDGNSLVFETEHDACECIFDAFAREHEYGEFVLSDIVAVNGDTIPEGLNDRQLSALLAAYDDEVETITLAGDSLSDILSNTEAEGEAEGEDDELLDADGVEPVAAPVQANTSPVGAFGSVTVTQAIGTPTINVGIRNKVTTVGDILRSDKVLAKFAMSADQLCSLSVAVNDVSAGLNDKLAIGDVIKVSPRKAGDKGLSA